MIDLSLLSGRKIAVLGLGRSGNAAAKALLAGGAEVLAWDDSPAARPRACRSSISRRSIGASRPR
jgi:UDP-N-acetylmuramoylalanine--D-glutamate ligase